MLLSSDKKIVAIHQPNYIPWIGYFYKIYLADIFVFFDDVQYSNSGMHNWHYIKTPQGPLRLKVPVKQKLGNKINEVKTRDHLDWKNKHLRSIEINYKKAPYFDEIYNQYAQILRRPYQNIAEMNKCLIFQICEQLEITTKIMNSSSLNVSSTGEDRIIEIVKVLGGTDYLSGLGAKAYQDEKNFTRNKIKLSYMAYNPSEYPQLWGDFHPNVSVIDYLMNCGFNWSYILENQQ